MLGKCSMLQFSGISEIIWCIWRRRHNNITSEYNNCTTELIVTVWPRVFETFLNRSNNLDTLVMCLVDICKASNIHLFLFPFIHYKFTFTSFFFHSYIHFSCSFIHSFIYSLLVLMFDITQRRFTWTRPTVTHINWFLYIINILNI